MDRRGTITTVVLVLSLLIGSYAGNNNKFTKKDNNKFTKNDKKDKKDKKKDVVEVKGSQKAQDTSSFGSHAWRLLNNHKVVNGFDIVILQHMAHISGVNGGDSTLDSDYDQVVPMLVEVTNRLESKYDSMPNMLNKIRTPFVMWRMARYYRPTDTLKGFQAYAECSTYYDTADLVNLVDTAFMDSITPHFWRERVKRFNRVFDARNDLSFYDYSERRCTSRNSLYMNDRDIGIIRIMSRISDSLGGHTFVYKYSTREGALLVMSLGDKIRSWFLALTEEPTRRQRYVKFMWELSKYADNTIGTHLKGFETKAICDSMYTIYVKGDPLKWDTLRYKHRPYNENLRTYLSMYAGDPE